jgi:hypothetical protein
MSRARNGSSLLLAAALLTATTEASAFCRRTTVAVDTNACKTGNGPCNADENGCPNQGNPLRWTHLPLTFRFSTRRPAQLVREEARAAIRAAFYRWSDTLCGPDQRRTSLRFVEGEEIVGDKPLVANARASEPFGIYFRDTGWPYVDKEDSTLAQTNTFFGKDSGVIEYADMEINTGFAGVQKITTGDNETSGADLQAVITHEVGHYIGLAHSRVPTSIMLESYCSAADSRCERGKVAARRLSDDDIQAVCAIYPPDLVLPDEDPSGHGPACAAAPGAWAHPGLAAAALCVLASSLVRRWRHSTKREPRNER